MIEWARLARVGGSTSAIGSSLLGSFLAKASIYDHILVSIISFSLFCGGMIMNDLLDVDKDRLLRPNRPLPSGRISIAAAKNTLFALIALTILLGILLRLDQFITILFTWITIYGYNGPLKKQALAASLSLASARALNFLIGLGLTHALQESYLFIPAGVIFLHTLSILIYSKGEDLAGPIPKGAWITQMLIFLVLCSWSLVSALLWITAVFIIISKHKAHDRSIRIKGVGWMVNAFCLLDTAIILGTVYQLWAPIWLLLLILGRFISRRYPAG